MTNLIQKHKETSLKIDLVATQATQKQTGYGRPDIASVSIKSEAQNMRCEIHFWRALNMIQICHISICYSCRNNEVVKLSQVSFVNYFIIYIFAHFRYLYKFVSRRLSCFPEVKFLSSIKLHF